MAEVKQQVLNWLYNVLKNEYKNVNRTYNDVAQLLSRYSSLFPKTDVYTYENGTSNLLLQISGTIPVVFRGTCYRFPIVLWVPHLYPEAAPMIYVTSSEFMVVRPGQHVDLQGKVYHPYLVGWAESTNKCNFIDFFEILREIFAKEPPVVSRPQNNIPPHPLLPQNTAIRLVLQLGENDSKTVSPPPPLPPPPPPKPKKTNEQLPSSGTYKRETGPPLPPVPGKPVNENINHKYQKNLLQNRNSLTPFNGNNTLSQSNYQKDSGESHDISKSTLPLTNQTCQSAKLNREDSISSPHQNRIFSHSRDHVYSEHQSQLQSSPVKQNIFPQTRSKTPPDLLSAPLTLTGTPKSNNDCTTLQVPPVPPNPEKDLLLQKIGHALHSQRQKALGQMNSSIPGLQAQYNAMLASLRQMETELQELESLNDLFASNSKILNTALQDVDNVILSSQNRASPSVDELLIAPSVVANQLYELVSEEKSIGDTLFLLGRAVEKGRIDATTFAKMTRSLSREWYLKKALVRKIGYGMGLITK